MIYNLSRQTKLRKQLARTRLWVPRTTRMQRTEVVPFFESLLQGDPEMSTAIAAIQTLMEFMKRNSAETIAELTSDLKGAMVELQTSDQSVVSVASGCELFFRFITLTALDMANFNDCKQLLVERGQLYLQKAAQARQKIGKLGVPFIRDGATILIHSRSRVVLTLLKEAASYNKHCTVFVTESCPDRSGLIMQKALQDAGIRAYVIVDAAVGYIMERIDLVMFGAEGVVESGGIINKVSFDAFRKSVYRRHKILYNRKHTHSNLLDIGTYQIAVVAKAANKPVYVVAESFKFLRQYPLNQFEAPNKHKYVNPQPNDFSDHPLVDYTPPSYINLLFTDFAVLTPSAVSDELIKLYC
ncbi:translation initiation factor eIF-2B subunit alpha-like isoform X1 [Corticium candelabrum]|uniref:translation initiation factor eIF-2B subunit alpha-like isoform X1 n=1 Tax=Corticium candelabrum TaxID=121492 RepID=UPI002E270FE1|nr:translation initiation factor eIF-2B subunit alpha-like isoform X1 [Corticium candelabrum]